MAIVIPNKADAVYPLQSRVYATHFQVLNAGGAGTFLGRQSNPMSVAPTTGMDILCHYWGTVSIQNVAKGIFADTTLTLGSDPTYDKWTLIFIENDGGTYSFTQRSGTASPSPEMPSIGLNECCLVSVYIPAGTTTLTSDMILELSSPTPNDLTPFMQVFQDTSPEDAISASRNFRDEIGLRRQSAGGWQSIGSCPASPVDATIDLNTQTVYVMMSNSTFYSWNGGTWTALDVPPSNAFQIVCVSNTYIYAMVDGGVDLWRYEISNDSWTQLASHPGATMAGCTMGTGLISGVFHIFVAGCETVQTDSRKFRYYNIDDNEWFTGSDQFSTTYSGLTLSKNFSYNGLVFWGGHDVVSGVDVALTGYYTPGTLLEDIGVNSYTGFPVVGGKWVSEGNHPLWNGLMLVNDD
jgi:hypothetical protein